MGWLVLAYSLASVPLAFWWCCCRTACPCIPTTQWTVVLTGTVAGSGSPCTGCSNLDGTYIIPMSPQLTIDCVGEGMEECTWGYQDYSTLNPCVASSGCDGMCVMVGQGYFADHRYFSVAIYSGSSVSGTCTPVGSTGWRGGFKKDWGSLVPTCANYASLAIPFSANIGSACDLSTATCTVTAS